MPSLSRARSPDGGAAVLIAAASGRALAAAARSAGYRPLAADFFGDMDTRALCAASCLIEGGLERGFGAETLIPALEALAQETFAQGEAPCGLVYGAGFEDRPELLEALARRWTLLGNAADVVRRVKDPHQLAGLCAALGIPHPEISARLPRDGTQWLAKAAGGSGGTHVAPAGSFAQNDENMYFQRFAEGEPVSILFLADGENTQTVGLSRQWVAPAPGEPYRFGGSLRPAGLSSRVEHALRKTAESVTAACGLRGLNSIDFLAAGNAWTLIEINPRPGATLDIFEDSMGSLFQAHVDACHGRLRERPLERTGAAAAGIAYVREEISSMPEFGWPSWASDRQRVQSALRPHDPLCTVKARAATPQHARACVDARTNLILDRLERIQNKRQSREGNAA